MLDLLGRSEPDRHDQRNLWVHSLGRGKREGKPVLRCPFAIAKIGVMADGSAAAEARLAL